MSPTSGASATTPGLIEAGLTDEQKAERHVAINCLRVMLLTAQINKIEAAAEKGHRRHTPGVVGDRSANALEGD